MPNGTATLPEEQVKEEQRVRPSRREFGPGEGIGSLAGGVIAVVLAILAIAGLAGVYPLTLLSLSAIGIGVCFLLDGAAVARRISTSLREATEGKTR